MPKGSQDSPEMKRLRNIIEEAAMAINNADLHMMMINISYLKEDDRDAIDRAIYGVRMARRILAER